MIPSAGLHTDQALLYSLTVSGSSWSNSAIAGYSSAPAKDDAALRMIAKDDAALRMIFARSATIPRPRPNRTAVRPVHLGVISL
jgi:hypothetical protein